MKKGFTLIELIATIGVLVIIILIAAPIINTIISDSKTKAYLETKKNIESAANLYVLRNVHDFPDVVGQRGFVTISQLKTAGLLRNDTLDPRTNSIITEGEIAVELQASGSYTYNYSSTDYVKTGLVLWYDAINHGSTNTIWSDLSGNGNNGTLSNFLYDATSGWQSDYINYRGTTEFITANNPLASQTTSNQSYTAFITYHINSLSVDTPKITGINLGLSLNWWATKKPLHYINSGVNDYYTYGKTVQNVGENFQLAFRFYKNASLNKMHVELYVNGVDDSADNFPENQVKTPAGMNANIVIMNMTGTRLYSIKIYNRILTDAEIKQNYNVDKDRFNF